MDKKWRIKFAAACPHCDYIISNTNPHYCYGNIYEVKVNLQITKNEYVKAD